MNDALGDRMKKNYENVSKTFLTRRMPVIIRLDGKAFHSFTKGFKKPFDKVFCDTMIKTTEYLCKNIQGCVFGYTQSDEISLLLVDYKNLNTDAWFNYSIQKCVSIAASMATMAFNREFAHQVRRYKEERIKDKTHIWNSYKDNYYVTIYNAISKGAMFDARIFNIPKEEVVNYFIWRQNDCYRNCINSVAQHLFSQAQLYKKNTLELKNLIGDKHDYKEWQLLGSSFLKCVNYKWDYSCFDFKQNRKLIEEQFIFN